MTALCNQPEAFASDLGDDQSRYLLIIGSLGRLNGADVKSQEVVYCRTDMNAMTED